jgi:hypothetical protein
MMCICGLSFQQVNWLRNRVRGYCSIKCRKDDVMGRFNQRKRNGKLQDLAGKLHGRAGIQTPSERGTDTRDHRQSLTG